MMIEDLFRRGILRLAEQPKDNPKSLSELEKLKLVLIPIDHDYPGGSAAMHNAVFRKYGLDYKTAFVVAKPEDVKLIIDTFREDPRYVGGGVGSGFKDKAVKYVDELSELAKILGSINVIQKQDGRLIGHNTDGIGFVRGFLREYPDSVAGRKILILGAGGTTLPITYELVMLNPREIVILNRTVEKAKNIADRLPKTVKNRYGGEGQIGVEVVDSDIVINTSNKGASELKEYTAFAPITGDHMNTALKNLRRLPQKAIVSDILLGDETPTLRLAKNRGLRVHNGKDMNLYQAIPAFKLMTGIKKILDSDLEDIMRNAR